MTSKSKKQQGVHSVEVGLRLVRALSASRRPMMLRDLAAVACMPPAKAHRYLVSLTRMGLVEQRVDSGRYDLGVFALDLGLSALARLEPLAVATPYLHELNEAIGHTVALAVWANRGATIVSWVGSDAPVAASLRVGSVMPLLRSATGQIFLAYLPKQLTARLLQEEMAVERRAGLARQSDAEIEAACAAIRARGFAETSDFIPGISGLAMPVFDYSGSLALAIVTLGYTGHVDLTVKGPLMTAVAQCARTLSERFGHQAI